MSFSEPESEEYEQVQVVDKKSNKRKECDISMYSPPNLWVRSLLKKPRRYEQANFVELINPVEPKTYEKAVSGPYEQHWKQYLKILKVQNASMQSGSSRSNEI